MTPTLTEILTALQNLAMKKGRPDYELCTAKQVKFALENGLVHHLIAELPFFEIMQKEQEKPLKPSETKGQRVFVSDEQNQEVVIWLKSFNGLYKDLAKKVGCSSSMIIHIKVQRSRCTLVMYNKIMKARKELEGMAA